MNAIRVGGTLFAVGLVVFVCSVLTGATAGCSAVGYVGEPPGGFEFVGFDGLEIVYTPDGGVNTCTMEFGYVFAPVGLVTLGLGSLVAGTGYVRAWF